MLKQTVTYTDFDGVEQTDTLYFNISKTELTDNMHLQSRFESLLKVFQAQQGDLTEAQVRDYLDLVKTVMKLAYGVRSEDGKRFKKSDEFWSDFQSSAAYDEYLFSLFANPEKANEFLIGVLPQDLRTQAEAQIAAESAGEAPPKDVSDEELLKMDPMKMTPDQLRRAFQLKNQ